MYDDKDLVVKTKIGLSGKSSPTGSGTSTLPRYEYSLESPATSANPTTEQVEKIRHIEKVYMTVTAKQIIKGMKSEKKFRTTTQTLEAIPKHLFAISSTGLPQNQGTGWKAYKQGWGICSVQGWALKKMLISMGIISTIGLAVFVLWLCLISPTDLQNASVAFPMLVAVMGLALAIPQYLDVV